LLILILSDINMPGTTGFELRPKTKAKAMRPDGFASAGAPCRKTMRTA
jgi:CheY-like chemotaxis protein